MPDIIMKKSLLYFEPQQYTASRDNTTSPLLVRFIVQTESVEAEWYGCGGRHCWVIRPRGPSCHVDVITTGVYHIGIIWRKIELGTAVWTFGWQNHIPSDI